MPTYASDHYPANIPNQQAYFSLQMKAYSSLRCQHKSEHPFYHQFWPGGPTADILKHPHTVTDPPPRLTMGTWYLGSFLVSTGRLTHSFSSLPNKLNVLSSLQRILGRCTQNHTLCFFVHTLQSVLFFLEIKAFLTPTLPFNPEEARRRFTMLTEIFGLFGVEILERIWRAVNFEFRLEAIKVPYQQEEWFFFGRSDFSLFLRLRFFIGLAVQQNTDCREILKTSEASIFECPSATNLMTLFFRLAS